MAFKPFDQVEVCSKADGFVGSYYTAIVLQISTSSYVVQHKNLVEEYDESTPLTETVSADELRPMPPKPPLVRAFVYQDMVDAPPLVRAFVYQDMVDAFHNDGWWVGKITAKKGFNYKVHFDTTGEEIAYHVSHLRFHQDWINGKWIIASKKTIF